LKEIYGKTTKKGVPFKQKTKPIMYSPTDKEYTLDDKLTQSTSWVQKERKNLVENPRLNLICVQYKILKPPKKEISGHQWTNNNTKYLDYKREFECGQVTFRIINDIILIIWIPERVIDKEHIRDLTPKVYSEAQLYANWFQQEFCCRLGLPTIYQNYHIAFRENDPLLCDLAKKHGMLKIVDAENRVIAWWDSSKGHTEFETRDERIAETRAFAPMKILWLEDKIEDMESKIFDNIWDKIEDSLISLIENKLNSALEKQFAKYFNNTKMPDNFRDVV